MGVHATPIVRVSSYQTMALKCKLSSSIILLCLVLSLHSIVSRAADADSLLKFKESLQNADALSNWNPTIPPCSDGKPNWDGVMCSKDTVWGLQLEGMKLKGSIDVDSLMELEGLRTVSFMNNDFDGPLPEMKKLGALKSVYLSGNQFSGKIPDDSFENMLSLKKLHLAKNQFTGTIPLSLTTLPKLIELNLEENKFEGKLPEFQQKELQVLNVSNNGLEGPIPASLSRLDKSSFSGNKGLCGEPTDACKLPTPSEDDAATNPNSSLDSGTSTGAKKLPIITILIVAIVVVVALVAIGAVIFILHRRNQAPQSLDALPSNLKKKVVPGELGKADHGSSNHSGIGRRSNNSKLSFVRDDRENFDLADLLKASAEILGSGCFGSSYRAALSTGTMMVVKRFKQMNTVAKDEFQEHMRRLGRLSHSNLLPLVAYYYRKEEKLLVTDYIGRGSLTVHLHENHALGQPSLDWPVRLKIVKGVARGLLYLYKELPSLITPHGHLKSSNVLLDHSFEPLLSDYGLVPIINQESAQELMVAYKSPEYLQLGRITKKTDVWSLGILILEILAGQLPATLPQEKGNDVDLASWVRSLRENGTIEVLDKEMGASKGSEGEMLKLLRIGLNCCEGDVENRLDIKEAVERIEEVRERDGDEEFYSTCASEADMRSSRGMSDELSFSIDK